MMITPHQTLHSAVARRFIRTSAILPVLLLWLLSVYPLCGQTQLPTIVGHENTVELVHYWNFNDNSTLSGLLTPTVSLVSGASLTITPGGMSYVNIAGGTGQNFDITNHNARLGDSAGAHLRFDNPIGGELIFTLPTTGFSDPVVRFAMRRSGQGAGLQYWHYSTDTAHTFIPFQTLVAINGNPLPITLDFSGIAGASDNPNFALRVTFAQGAGGTGGNNRFDNFTLDAEPILPTPRIGANADTLPHFNHLFGTPSASAGVNISAILLTHDIEVLAPATFEVSTSPDTGFVQGLTLPHVSGSVPLANLYVRLNAPAPGTFHGNLLITSSGADTVRLALSGTCLTQPPPLTLVSYWHFNTLNTDTGDVKEIPADHHAIPGTSARMIYTGGNPGDRDIDVYIDGSQLNLHLGEAAGQAARVRNPSDNRTLIFELPTNNFRNLLFSYAVHRSNNGQLSHELDYSTDGINYTQAGMTQTTFHVDDIYGLVVAGFTGITAAENNPSFRIRITFIGNTGGISGNNRFDNITLEGEVISSTDHYATDAERRLVVFPNPVSGGTPLRLSEKATFRILDLNGRQVLAGHDTDEVSTTGLAPGLYLLLTDYGRVLKVIVH
jgi:hypothetical protein